MFLVCKGAPKTADDYEQPLRVSAANNRGGSDPAVPGYAYRWMWRWPKTKYNNSIAIGGPMGGTDNC
jgi:hypothetical protein